LPDLACRSLLTKFTYVSAATVGFFNQATAETTLESQADKEVLYGPLNGVKSACSEVFLISSFRYLM
jgi:hypothetical protein